MNRSANKLKPLAMKLDTPHHGGVYFGAGGQQSTHESKNKNAFAGSHLGVPAGPLENVTSMDPRDYVWGVPQAQPGLYASAPLPHGCYAPTQYQQTHVPFVGAHAAASTETGIPATFTGETLLCPRTW